MAQAPHIRCERRYLVGRKLRPTHRRHGAAILFRLRHTFGYRFRDSGIAAIAPQPFLLSGLAPKGCLAALTMAARARGSAHLAP